MNPICVGCNKPPSEIDEYEDFYEDEGYESAASYVKENEGTYNPKNGHFWCTECYANAGMPLGLAK